MKTKRTRLINKKIKVNFRLKDGGTLKVPATRLKRINYWVNKKIKKPKKISLWNPIKDNHRQEQMGNTRPKRLGLSASKSLRGCRLPIKTNSHTPAVKIKQPKDRWINIMNKKSWNQQFRDTWLADGIDLVDISQLCEVKINCHGVCNDFNSPEENIYHIKITYRGDVIAQYDGGRFEIIDDDEYVMFTDRDDNDNGFIIFRKVKVKHEKRNKK